MILAADFKRCMQCLMKKRSPLFRFVSTVLVVDLYTQFMDESKSAAVSPSCQQAILHRKQYGYFHVRDLIPGCTSVMPFSD